MISNAGTHELHAVFWEISVGSEDFFGEYPKNRMSARFSRKFRLLQRLPQPSCVKTRLVWPQKHLTEVYAFGPRASRRLVTLDVDWDATASQRVPARWRLRPPGGGGTTDRYASTRYTDGTRFCGHVCEECTLGFCWSMGFFVARDDEFCFVGFELSVCNCNIDSSHWNGSFGLYKNCCLFLVWDILRLPVKRNFIKCSFVT